MRKHGKLLMPLFAGAILLTAGPAIGQYAAYPDGREPAYNVTFYSDSTYTTPVGYQYPDCGYHGVVYSTPVGQRTDYGANTFVGYCTVNGWDPL